MNDETVNPLKPISLEDLGKIVNLERKERLKNGFTISNLTVTFKKSNFTIQFWNENKNQSFYEVDLEKCTNEHQLLFWIFQLKTKIKYIDEPVLIYGFLTILDDACIEVFKEYSKRLYYDGFKLDWSKGTYSK